MKNIHPKKSAEGSASLILNDKDNNAYPPPQQKAVITDECGDTLWEDILAQNENNLPGNGKGENQQSAGEQGNIKDRY